MSAPKATRREFIVGVAAFVACATVGGIARPAVAQADVLRPPGALAEADFMARCIKCERCTSVCPTNVIAPLGIEGGILQARTPTLDYSNNCCTFCDKCREVCPTGAIGAIDPHAPEKDRIGVAMLVPDACLAFYEPGSCGKCEEACPYDAISFDDERKPVVDSSLCNGCGECVHVCPASVFTRFSGEQTRGIEVVTENTFARSGGAQ